MHAAETVVGTLYNTTMHYHFQSLEDEANDNLRRWCGSWKASVEVLSDHVEKRQAAWFDLGARIADDIPLNESMVPVLNRYEARFAIVEQFLHELSEEQRRVPSVPDYAIRAGNLLQMWASTMGRFWLETSWRPQASCASISTYAREAVRHGLETPHLLQNVAHRMEESSIFWEHAMLHIVNKGLQDEHAETLKHGLARCSHQPGDAFVFYCVGPGLGGAVPRFAKTFWPEWFQRLRKADATVETLYGALPWMEQVEAVNTLLAGGTPAPAETLDIGHLEL